MSTPQLWYFPSKFEQKQQELREALPDPKKIQAHLAGVTVKGNNYADVSQLYIHKKAYKQR